MIYSGNAFLFKSTLHHNISMVYNNPLTLGTKTLFSLTVIINYEK